MRRRARIRSSQSVMIFVIFVWLSTPLYAQKFTVYTEEFPPFNFTEDDKITGVSTEIVEAVLKKTGCDYEIRSYPWARTYRLAQRNPNSLVYSISRRAKREKLFKWIGIIVPSVHSVFVLKSRTDIVIENLEDLKQYKIGTTIEDARETYLIRQGFKVDDLQRVGGETAYLQNYEKLKLKRIDLWPMPDAVAHYVVRKAGDDPGKVLRKVFEFSGLSKGGYYMAASLGTSDEIVGKIRKLLEDFKKAPQYGRVLKKWGLE